MNYQCPFCLIKGESHYIRFPIYITFFVAIASGISCGVTDWFKIPELDLKTFSRIRSQLGRPVKNADVGCLKTNRSTWGSDMKPLKVITTNNSNIRQPNQ